jgi:type I restriction enzyme S subunit
MQQNWKTYKFGDIATLQRGFDLPRQNRVLGSIPIIAASGIGGYHNISKVEGPGVVTGRSGTIGKVMYEKGDFWPLNTSLWVKNFHGNDKKFVYYLLTNFDFKGFNNGTSVPTLNRNDVHGIDISIPSLQEQRAIASILSALDDKIEINLQMNKTLEEMSLALYKHWFVDFGPFQNGGFVDSELGMIPEGWEVKRLGDVAEVGSSKRIFLKEYVEGGIPFYRGKEIIQLGKGGNISTELFISKERFKTIKEKFGVPLKNDILISSVGTIGVSWLVENDDPFYFKDGNLTWLKNYKKSVTGNLIYQWLKSKETQEKIKSETIGSTQQALTISALRTLKIALPPVDSSVVKDVSKEFVLWNKLFVSNKMENQILITLRDTLLPKLISGEVRVKDIKQTIAQVL